MRRWYISGPMSGHEDYNYTRFDYAKKMVEEYDPDGVVISPHESGPRHGLLAGVSTQDEFYRAGLIDLAACTDIVMIGGWPQSEGAKLELYCALTLDMTVWFLDDDNVLRNMTQGIKNTRRFR
jgi:hypothetical protein